MTQTATLLLLLAGEPTRHEHALLADFARQKRIEFVAPAPTPVTPYPAYRSELVLDLEGRLDEARTLASSLDEERALTLLASIERDIVDHPELPQAAWLLAEHHRIAADARAGDADAAEQAAALSHAAIVLEGPRAPAFGASAESAVAAEPSARVHVKDLGPRDELEIDGESGGSERRLAPGVHQVRVLRDGDLVFAGWAELGTEPEVTLGLRPLVACSSEDLAHTGASGGAVVVPHAVACAHWFVARPRPGGLELASCEHAACSGFTPLLDPAPPPRAFPPWATAALVSAGAVAAGLLSTWAAGGFEREHAAPPRTVFVYGGLH
ncbi:MAG TPA: hypothetical protein VMI54_19775 [Polyangiaceae bacterium]|nr:hypothetical protein [Polyangiaceae bacterium]